MKGTLGASLAVFGVLVLLSWRRITRAYSARLLRTAQQERAHRSVAFMLLGGVSAIALSYLIIGLGVVLMVVGTDLAL